MLITWVDGDQVVHGPFRGHFHAAAYAEDIIERSEGKAKAVPRQLLEPYVS